MLGSPSNTVDPHLGVPGEGRATYLYAHAQAGMFLPLLTQSQVSNGKKMMGMVVEVWTNDDQRFLYVITKVLRHVACDHGVRPRRSPTRPTQLWLQTSEGRAPQPKLQLVADRSRRKPRPTTTPTRRRTARAAVQRREVC